MQNFSVRHALSFSTSSLVIAHHNEIIHLAIQYFSPKFVSGEPLIHLVRIISEEEVSHRGSVTETRGDVSIRGLWKIHMETIIGIIFGDAAMETWKLEVMDKLLDWWEIFKNNNHGQHCYNQRKFFSPFFFSFYGMMG